MKRAALVILVPLLAACSGGGGAVASPSSPPAAVASTAAPAPTTVAAAPEVKEFTGAPEDFTIGVDILEKKCFGSAGCNVTFRIIPGYEGTQVLPLVGTVEVTYEVTTDEESLINTFVIEKNQASFDDREQIQTLTSDSEIVAKATKVRHNRS